MKFSYSWLKELSGYNGTPEKLAEVLSFHAFETEVSAGQEFKNIIVAKVTKIEKHPNADRVRVITLTDGENTYYPVVCGAWNFEEGAIVPLALPGATIPHDQHDPEGKSFILGKATIRGVESQGMICSGKELGLSAEGDGIMLLPKDYKLGESFVGKGSNIQLEISVPANRPDLLGYLGVAREISALTGSKLNYRDPKIVLEKFKPKILKVNISSTKLCSRYLAVRLRNIEIGPTPAIIADRLREAGHKSINNIVDITNYVMLETGQPLHAFDAGKILGNISVRPAYVNEKIKTLDGETRQLSPQNLIIADTKQPLAIAGVMGGESSRIDEFTNEIILESANFDPVSVRRTSREMGLRTDASARFEKSLPQGLTDYALALACELLVKACRAEVVECIKAGQKNPPDRHIAVDAGRVNELLGSKIETAEQKKILGKFGFKSGSGDKYRVAVPFIRPDVVQWQDLAEEIGRFNGLDQIDSVPPIVYPSFDMTNPLVGLKQEFVNVLTALGYSEIYSYSFVSKKDLERWSIDPKIVLSVTNPQSVDQEFLRPNILVSMMKSAESNAKHTAPGNYFEIGDIYWRQGKELLQKTYLGMISYDRDFPVAKLTASFCELGRRMNIPIEIEQESEQIGLIKIGKAVFGRIGRIDIGELKWVGVHVDFEALAKHRVAKTFVAIPKYPAIALDVAVWARKDIQWGKIEQVVRSIGSELIQQVELLEVYTGKNVPLGRKSVAFRIVYQSSEKTLTEPEVTAIHNQVLKELKARLNLEVR